MRQGDSIHDPVLRICHVTYGLIPLGSGSCDPCPAGTATQQVGAALCVDCLPGGYGALEGQSVCENCEPGTFQKRGGKSSVFLSHFSLNAGSTSCDDCEPASFSGNCHLLFWPNVVSEWLLFVLNVLLRKGDAILSGKGVPHLLLLQYAKL